MRLSRIVFTILFLFTVLTSTCFASVFYLKTTTAAEPKPNATQQIDDTPDASFNGAFGAVLDATFTAPSLTRATVRSMLYTTGVGGNHYSESIPWISFPIAASATGSGTFSVKINSYLSAVPEVAVIKLKAALFRWGADDTKKEQIGTTQTTLALTATTTSYTLTFGTDDVTFADGDKLYVEFWFHALDSLGDSSVITCSVSYNTVAIDAKITAPGTQTELISLRLLPLTGVGQ